MEPGIELRHLRYFVAVAEELHFGRAAKRLHLQQPPLSQQIRRLEEMLGYPLFVRSSRSVRLTEAGLLYVERARRTLRAVAADVEEVRRLGRGEVGSLRVGFIGSCMLTRAPLVLEQYRRAFPAVDLSLHESFTSQVIEGLENGSLDAGLLRDGGPREGLEVEPIFSEPFVAVLPSSHRLAAGRSIDPAALREEPFVFYARSAGELAWQRPLSLLAPNGGVFQPRVVQEASHWLTILRLIEAGLGVSIAPACVAKIAPPTVVCRSLRGARMRSQIELAYRTGESRAVVEEFARLTRRVFAAPETRRPARPELPIRNGTLRGVAR